MTPAINNDKRGWPDSEGFCPERISLCMVEIAFLDTFSMTYDFI